MALNWNIEKCNNWKELGTDEEWPITNVMIWATMAVGIREITKANAQKFYDRVHAYEKTTGTWLKRNREDQFITLADVKKRIGLYTNAGTYTDSQFNANLKRHAH